MYAIVTELCQFSFDVVALDLAFALGARLGRGVVSGVVVVAVLRSCGVPDAASSPSRHDDDDDDDAVFTED